MSRLRQEDARMYLLSGRAMITLHNTQPLSGQQAQFKFIVRRKIDKYTQEPEDIWWVRTADTQIPQYLGHIINNEFHLCEALQDLTHPQHKLVGKSPAVFAWLWKAILKQNVPDFIHLLHTGQCGRCGRKLTDAISINTGIGPECRKILGIMDAKMKER